ncbi:hypothetical protein Spa11_28830 [Botrimarina mediterranea]|uniref:Uncharacterized protein n=1 Tax=Botrimarina mediterranea TaxID=2528022 RepID=A0A518KA66_9BACT|nr:hypothetical protein Spa11_28830 [Botrimarina mediterranea]
MFRTDPGFSRDGYLVIDRDSISDLNIRVDHHPETVMLEYQTSSNLSLWR